MEFERKPGGAVICTCPLDEEARQLKETNEVWVGGEHLRTVVPGTDDVVHVHYYPNRARGVILILKIENVEPNSDVTSPTDG